MAEQFLLSMIQALRNSEAVVLYNNIVKSSTDEEMQLLRFLEFEYKIESLEHPFSGAKFSSEAALWAAKTCFVAAQLILLRKDHPASLPQLFPQDEFEYTVENALSADLCLRFIPDMIKKLEEIDAEDELIEILKEKLLLWPYSAISMLDQNTDFDIDRLLIDPCIRQLSIDRIIEVKNTYLAAHPQINKHIKSALGDYSNTYWAEFSTTEVNE